MAKVTGPLMSIGASGKFGGSMVHFPWKGLAVVRQLVTPVNKQTAPQGKQRQVLGGTGRAVGEIKANVGVTSAVTAFAQQLIDLGLIPSGQTKQSYLVKYIIDHYISTPALYTAELAELTAHTSYAAFGASATTLGLTDFVLAYSSLATYDKALGLYLIAKSAQALGFTGTPYTTALTAWVTADVEGMVADFTSA